MFITEPSTPGSDCQLSDVYRTGYVLSNAARVQPETSGDRVP